MPPRKKACKILPVCFSNQLLINKHIRSKIRSATFQNWASQSSGSPIGIVRLGHSVNNLIKGKDEYQLNLLNLNLYWYSYITLQICFIRPTASLIRSTFIYQLNFKVKGLIECPQEWLPKKTIFFINLAILWRFCYLFWFRCIYLCFWKW